MFVLRFSGINIHWYTYKNEIFILLKQSQQQHSVFSFLLEQPQVVTIYVLLAYF